MSLTINSKLGDYDVNFEKSFDFIENLLLEKNSVFIIDKNIFKLYKKYFKKINSDDIFLFDAIEKNKTFDYVMKIYDFLLQKSFKRSSTLISIGGGITQDITGFVSSTFYRGVKWIFVPTTFLAMTDSCIGSKTSVNYNKHKNLMGTFYPPKKIIINKDFLLTLDELDFYSGVGESIKFSLMEESYPKDLESIKLKIASIVSSPDVREDIIRSNMIIKKSFMDDDEFDTGKRNLLNYGHCYGHALETSSDYFIPHGIAVNIGMIFANFISKNRKLLNVNDCEYVNRHILMPNIPLELRSSDFNKDVLLESLLNDKKRVGKDLSVVVPLDDFRMIKLTDIKVDEFKDAHNAILEFFFKEKVN